MKKITIVSALTASFFTASAFADLNNVYVEGAIGNAHIEGHGDSTKDTSFSFLGGYQVFSKGPLSLGTELGYNQYISKDIKTPGGELESTLSSVSIGGKVAYEVMPKLQVFGRLAYESIKKEVEAGGVTFSDSSNELTYAIGTSYEVAEQITLGAQYKYAQLDYGIDLSNMSLSVGYQF